MSRGLSKNQRRILGIAYGANCYFGQPGVKTGKPVSNCKVPAVDYVGVKDMLWPIAAHKLFELPFTQEGQTIVKSNGYVCPATGYFDLTEKKAKSAKASVVRAITSLCAREFLILAPDDTSFRWGYVLTEAGFEIAKEHHESVTDYELFRSGMIRYPSSQDSAARIGRAIANGDVTLSQVMEKLKGSGWSAWRSIVEDINETE